MGNILLDYVFPITDIVPTPQASTAFLKQVLIVVPPKSGQEGNVGTIYPCVTMSQVSARTDNAEAQQLFNAGMAKVFVLLADDLDLVEALDGHENDFFTILIGSDFDKDAISLSQAQGTVTVSSYANLVSGTHDTLTIGETVFTADTGEVNPGEATFLATVSNNSTAQSLCDQINAHEAASALVVATVLNAVVTIKAKTPGVGGNSIALAYTDHDTNVGITLSGLSMGNLAGGAGLDTGAFKGVVGLSESDDDFLADQAVIENRCAFHVDPANGAKNLFFAFGSLLSNALAWRNQQYITMPVADDVDLAGTANSLFDAKISFVISDEQYGNRLALLAAGGKAIVAPYILKNLKVDLQSEALSYISGNEPDYNLVEAALLQDELKNVIQGYIARSEITAGTVEITLVEENFVASGAINVAEPKALWRVVSEMRQTL